MNSIRAGVFQCEGGGLTPQQRIHKLAIIAGESELDLIVCPELFLSGYAVGNDLRLLAEPLDGSMMAQVKQVAVSSQTAIIVGYPERDSEIVYNSAACISAQGDVLANHRKLMIPPGFEGQYFVPGCKQTLFVLGGIRCAILVCFDAEFPESVRAAAQAGAQMVIVPTALGKAWPVVAHKVMPSRAFENGIWFIYANHAGVEGGSHYLGASCIITPQGYDAARAGASEELIHCKVDEDSVLKAQKRLPFIPFSAVLKKRLDY